MKKLNIIFSLVFSLSILVACGGSSDDSPTPGPTPPPIVEKPGISNPISPGANTVCQGEDVSDTEVKVNFSSTSATKTNSYIYKISNSSGTLVERITSSSSSGNTNLEKGKAYTYTITTKNKDGETVSSTVSFSTPGIANVNYVPVVSQITFNLASDMITIQFFDNDDDDLKYTVYTANNSGFTNQVELAKDIETSSGNEIVFQNVGLVANTPFWVHVVLSDSVGNQSNTVRSFVY